MEVRSEPKADRNLVIHEARYGYSDPLWAPAVCKAALGLQDVTLVVRSLVSRDELHINPDRKPQYMNQIFSFSDPTPKKRRLGVRFSYGDGPIYETTTDGVDQETVALHVTGGPVEEGGPAQGWIGKLKLLNRQDENVLRFPDLRAGGAFSRLRCTGSVMGGIVLEYPETRQAGPWAYTEIGLGPVKDAISVSYDGEFVMRDDGRVLDVSMWSYEVHNHLVIVRGPNDAETFQGRGGNGGRSFTLNDDQTISPTQAPHLALGVVPKTLRIVAPEEIKAAAYARRDEKDEAMKRKVFIEDLRGAEAMNQYYSKSQMHLLQTGPTVDTLLEVLTPTAFKDFAWGEGWGTVPVWEDLETATFLLTLVSDVFRADARMCDIILKDVSGRECGQLQTALLRFISGAGNKIAQRYGDLPRLDKVRTKAPKHAACLLTEVLVQGGAMDSEVVKELVTRLVGKGDQRIHFGNRELMMGLLTRLMEQPDHRELIESQPGVRELIEKPEDTPKA